MKKSKNSVQNKVCSLIVLAIMLSNEQKCSAMSFLLTPDVLASYYTGPVKYAMPLEHQLSVSMVTWLVKYQRKLEISYFFVEKTQNSCYSVVVFFLNHILHYYMSYIRWHKTKTVCGF